MCKSKTGFFKSRYHYAVVHLCARAMKRLYMYVYLCARTCVGVFFGHDPIALEVHYGAMPRELVESDEDDSAHHNEHP